LRVRPRPPGRCNSSERKRFYSWVVYLVLFDTSLESESVILYSKFSIKINHVFGRISCYGKNKIQNKQSSVTSIKWLCHEVHTKCCLKSQNYVIRKNWKNYAWMKTSEWKTVSENDERKWSERKRNLVTMDTDSHSREVSNKILFIETNLEIKIFFHCVFIHALLEMARKRTGRVKM
jgi:hypothetical protein